MMNRITQVGVAVVALAAPALIALPAAADAPAASATIATRIGENSTLFLQIGNSYQPASYGYRGARPSYRASPAERRTMEAIQACRIGIQREARRIGYRDVDFDSRAWAQPIGRGDYSVRFREVEFEGRRHDVERSVSCIVRNGYVTDIDGLPRLKGGPRYDHRGYRH